MPPVLAAISVLVVIATGDPADGSTRTMEHALRAALGPDAVIVMRTSPAGATDEALVSAAAADRTTLIGVVSWSDHQRRATLHFVTLPEGRWSDREIRFDASDAAPERGRTIGFALASMVPDDALAARDHAAAEPPRAPVVPLPSVAPPPPDPKEAAAPLPRSYRMGVDAAALAVTGLGGYGGGVGAVLGFRVSLAGPLAGRAALGARVGEIGPAQATSRVLSGGLGAAWQVSLDARGQWGIGARADALVLHHEVSHFSADDLSANARSRFVPAFDAALEGTFRFAESAAVVTAAGTEVALGQTKVVVKGREVASLPPARLFAEAGLRLLF